MFRELFIALSEFWSATNLNRLYWLLTLSIGWWAAEVVGVSQGGHSWLARVAGQASQVWSELRDFPGDSFE